MMEDSTCDSHDCRHRVQCSEDVVEEDQDNIFQKEAIGVEITLLSYFLSAHHCSKLFVDLFLYPSLFSIRYTKTRKTNLFVNAQMPQQFFASTVFVLSLYIASFPQPLIKLP